MTAEKTRDEILGALPWGPAKEVNTKRGPKLVASVPVTDEVMELWTREKDEMFKLGYSLSQYRGKWQLSRWSAVSTEVIETRKAAIELSRATDAQIEVGAPDGLAYLGYQRAGIKFGMDRDSCLIGDEMGLGKTIQGIGIINATPEAKFILIICPASLKLNWAREVRKWSLVKRYTYIADSKQFIVEPGVHIINYDILHKHRAALLSVSWDILISDEAHYLKSDTSRRTKMVFGCEERKDKKTGEIKQEAIAPLNAKRRILLTGTPIANRPIELYPLIHYLDPVTWSNRFKFGLRYCGAVKNGFGWDFSGASNLDELQDRLRATILIRRLKKDVLTELPPKRRQIIEIPAEGELEGFANAEQEEYDLHEDGFAELHARVEMAKASDSLTEYEAAVAELKNGMDAYFGTISRARRELAEAKTKYCIEHIREAVEASGKVVVMAHHKKVIADIKAAFGAEAVVLVGETSMNDRQAAVDRFQKDPTCKLFIGSLMAAGVGITLTAAAHVIFCELDWVPGNVSQAEDRCHRIGQTNSVLIQHLVVEGSLDATIAKRIVQKQEVIDKALDEVRVKIEGEPVQTERKDRDGATVGTPRDQIAKLALEMTDDQRRAAHEALRYLSSMCNGARDWDGMGFSKIDTMLGKDLAARDVLTPKQAALASKIAKKYAKTQLPESLSHRL